RTRGGRKCPLSLLVWPLRWGSAGAPRPLGSAPAARELGSAAPSALLGSEPAALGSGASPLGSGASRLELHRDGSPTIPAPAQQARSLSPDGLEPSRGDAAAEPRHSVGPPAPSP